LSFLINTILFGYQSKITFEPDLNITIATDANYQSQPKSGSFIKMECNLSIHGLKSNCKYFAHIGLL